MNIKKVLKESCIAMDLHSNTKTGIIEELVDVLVVAGKITDKQAAVAAVIERERKGSTGLQHGVAIPHGKTNTVEGLVAALGIKKNGVDFASHDGEPCRIFVLTVSPANRTGPHMEYLAEIGRLLEQASVRERILAAHTQTEVIGIITEDSK